MVSLCEKKCFEDGCSEELICLGSSSQEMSFCWPNPHDHDPNEKRSLYACLNGHRWLRIHYIPCLKCDYNSDKQPETWKKYEVIL